MSQVDETSPNPVETLPSVTRNGITKTLTKAVFSQKNEKLKGMPFFYPTLEEPKVETLSLSDGTTVQAIRNISDILWFGVDQVSGMVDKVAKQVFSAMATSNMELNEGVLNLEEFLVEAEEFTAARESLTNLRDELDDLQALQQTYSMDENFGAEESITEQGTGEQKMVKTARAIELEKLMKDNSNKIRPLRVKIDSIKKQNELAAEKRAQTIASNKAKKEALKGGQVVSPA